MIINNYSIVKSSKMFTSPEQVPSIALRISSLALFFLMVIQYVTLNRGLLQRIITGEKAGKGYRAIGDQIGTLQNFY